MEPLILCHIFPQRSQDEEEVLRHFEHLLFEFNPATPSSYWRCARPPSLLQFWRCAPKEDVLVQDQLDNGEDVKGVVHHREHSIIEKTQELVVRKYYGDLQLLQMPTHCQKCTSYDLILVIISRLTKMIHYKPVQIPIDALRLSDFIVSD